MKQTSNQALTMLWLVGNSRYDTINGTMCYSQCLLWLVGNSRYDTIEPVFPRVKILLWLVGNSRYDTIGESVYLTLCGYGLSGIHAMIQSWATRGAGGMCYGLSGIHAMIQYNAPNYTANPCYGLSGIHAMIQYDRRRPRDGTAMACREFTL